MSTARTVLVPPERIERWFLNFASRHGQPQFTVAHGCLTAIADDGEHAVAALPFDREYDGPADVSSFAADAATEVRWGVLLVRKGGFAVAALEGSKSLASKVGQRHVQGRSKAGGQSQQRFSRRRDNQARQAYQAAAEHAHRILVHESGGHEALVCGGDRGAVDAVLTDPRLASLAAVRTEPWLAVPDPRRGVLEQAALDGRSVSVRLEPSRGS